MPRGSRARNSNGAMAYRFRKSSSANANIPRFIPNRLPACFQIDDAEAPHAQRQARRAAFVGEKTFVVQAAMQQRRGHRPHTRLRLAGAVGEGDPANAAHALTQSPGREKTPSPREGTARAGGIEGFSDDCPRTNRAEFEAVERRP